MQIDTSNLVTTKKISKDKLVINHVYGFKYKHEKECRIFGQVKHNYNKNDENEYNGLYFCPFNDCIWTRIDNRILMGDFYEVKSVSDTLKL